MASVVVLNAATFDADLLERLPERSLVYHNSLHDAPTVSYIALVEIPSTVPSCTRGARVSRLGGTWDVTVPRQACISLAHVQLRSRSTLSAR